MKHFDIPYFIRMENGEMKEGLGIITSTKLEMKMEKSQQITQKYKGS